MSDGPDDSIERSCISAGYELLAGVDEAGRGPLAGPVVAAAIIFPLPCHIEGLNDSKKLGPIKRENLYERIIDSGADYAVGVIEPDVIDRVNILQATLLAMRDAVEGLRQRPAMILVDGISRPPVSIPQKLVKKGDGRCVSIAAASIVAKVTRDRMMTKLHKIYPAYGFDSHFGYGTRSHMEAIRLNGPSPAHRLTFRGVKGNRGD